MVAPGVLCIDREDSSGNATPTKREYITFTGVAGNDLTGVTRGVSGSTDQAHSSGALIEENWSVKHWGDAVDFLQVSHDSAGKIVASAATLVSPRIVTSLQASGASIVGLGINPVWSISASTSAASTGIGTSVAMPHTGAFEFFSMTLARGQAVSAASLVIDINKNGTSIFETGTRPFILGGGTFVSTASINTKLFNSGDVINVDKDTTTNLGNLASSTSSLDFTVLGHAAVIGR